MSAQLKVNDLQAVEAELTELNARKKVLEQKRFELNGSSSRATSHKGFMEAQLDISFFTILKGLGSFALGSLPFRR